VAFGAARRGADLSEVQCRIAAIVRIEKRAFHLHGSIGQPGRALRWFPISDFSALRQA